MKKIAVVGLGMMGINHIKALRGLGYSPYYVIDSDAAKAKKIAFEYGIPNWSSDLDTALEQGLDVVHICTPPLSHYESVKKALEKGVHVICEKPFVFDEKQAEELASLAKEKNLVNAIDFNVRYHQACAQAHEMASEFGSILLVHGSYCQEFHALPSVFSWRYDKEQAGKFLATTEIGSHWIDTLRFITGLEVKAVSASYGCFMADRVVVDGLQYEKGSEPKEGKDFYSDFDNTALVSFRLSNGALANMVLSEITPGRSNYLEINITGSKKAFWWNTEDLNRYHIGIKGQPVQEHVLAFGDGFNASIGNMLSDVYKDIESGQMSKSHLYASFEDGLINTKICNAIYRSAHNDSVWEEIV